VRFTRQAGTDANERFRFGFAESHAAAVKDTAITIDKTITAMDSLRNNWSPDGPSGVLDTSAMPLRTLMDKVAYLASNQECSKRLS
jgi:hypothetical protein